MRPPLATRLLARLLPLLLAVPLAAQGSRYLHGDDPNVRLFEQLVIRGAVIDPSPQVRPLRTAEAVTALRRATVAPDSPSGRLVAALLARWAPDSATAWDFEARVGAQGYSSARRDLLHAEGKERFEPFAISGLGGTFGPAALSIRILSEDRLASDPDWTGTAAQRSKSLQYRPLEGYVNAAFGPVRVHAGQVDREWGPLGVPGLALANSEAYARPDLTAEFRSSRLNAWFLVGSLHGERDTAGVMRPKAFVAHRLAWRPDDRLDIALWETMVIGGPREVGGRALAGTLYPYTVARALFDVEDDRNVILGLDLSWRPSPALGVQAQFALDDLGELDAERYPRHARYAGSLALHGPLGDRATWHAGYSRVSSLAYLTPLKDGTTAQIFVDRGAGIVRIFPDNDRATVRVALPLRERWLVQPELALQRQGESRLSDVFPEGEALRAVPTFLVGTVERRLQLGLGIEGEAKRVRLNAFGGVQRISNLGHVAGRDATRFEGRLMLSYGFTMGGPVE